ncbi:hypothetical protein B0H66DRAFT_511281 [Apodospora peruviana]|uniref:SET domain-containing protein n=1 Tax=Apodospora peruviana TaxID=516989 RepID=A0AAE0MA56_9PEZI|nr:hypothetical protein B0H66DRAFT_511281 [Apodospora peruviana]
MARHIYLLHIPALNLIILALCHFALAITPEVSIQCPWDPVSPFRLRGRSCPAPIDDDSESSANLAKTPWTHPPYCLSLAHVEDKLCVYSSSAFNDNAGISIIAHPSTAATLVQAVSNPVPAWYARQHIAHSPSTTTGPAKNVKYKVGTIPGKGKGVIATRHIDQFQTIMVSFPAMIVDNELFPAEEDEGPVEGPRLFRKALAQLTDRERFLGLARSREHQSVDVVEDVIRTNAFGITTLDGRDAKGLYPEIAVTLNHGCDPNAYGRYTKGDLAMSAVATRDIEPGEEITISYLPLGMPTTIRRKSLANWGFNCTCSLCSAPKEARDASDRRRERLVELYYAMREPDTEYDTLVELTREFVDIVQIERLFPKVGEYYQAFMKLYYDYGDVESAYRYARTALKFAETFADPEGGFCGGLRGDIRLLEDLLERGEYPQA